MRNLKIICLGEVYKINKPPSLSFKSFKNETPEKMENGILFSKFEILATNIDWSQILKEKKTSVSNYCR